MRDLLWIMFATVRVRRKSTKRAIGILTWGTEIRVFDTENGVSWRERPTGKRPLMELEMRLDQEDDWLATYKRERRK